MGTKTIVENYLTVYKVQRLKAILDVINTFTDEVTLTIGPGGVKADIMAPDRFRLIQLELPDSFFDGYRFEEEHRVTFNLKQALKVMRTYRKDTEIAIALEESSLLFRSRVGGADVDKRIPLLEDPEEETLIPKIAYTSTALVNIPTLLTMVTDTTLISDSCSFKITDDLIHIGANGDAGAYDGTLDRGAVELITIRAEKENVAIYSAHYLMESLKDLNRITDAVEVSINTDAPIRLSPDLPCGRIAVYLAPCREYGSTPTDVTLGFESVTWIPRPTLVYHKGDIPAPHAPEPAPEVPPEPFELEVPRAIPHEDPEPEIPEPAPVDVEDPGAEEIPAEVPVPHEDPAETVIEELPQAPVIDPWILHEARVKYYRDNPGVYEAPALEQLQPYLEGAA